MRSITSPSRLVGFKNVGLSQDGKLMALTLITEPGADLDVAIPLDSLGEIINYLTITAARLTEQATGAGLQIAPAAVEPEPIAVRKIGMTAGRTPDETLLTVETAGYGLTFAVPVASAKPQAELRNAA